MQLKYMIPAGVLIAAAAAWFALAPPRVQPETALKPVVEIPVIAVAPVMRDIPLFIETVGTLRPSAFLEIRPQVSGVLVETLVAEGQWIDPATPLFRIDSQPYLIKVKEAEAQLTMDQLAYEAANKKLDRYRSLAQKDLVSQIEWDELETQAEKAKAQLTLDEARLQTARLDLDRCVLTAPIKGRLGKIDAHPGTLTSSLQTTPLTTLSSMDPLVVEFEITEGEFPTILDKQTPIQIHSICSKPSQTTGTITYFDNQFHPTSGLLLVRGTVPNPDFTLRPGQSVRVQIPIEVIHHAQLIPQKAIRYSPEGPYVLVVQEDRTIAQRQIELGQTQGNEVVVRQGLNLSESVVTEGHLRLTPGTKVALK